MSAGNTNVKNDKNVFLQTKTAYASASRRLVRESRTNIWQRFLQRKKTGATQYCKVDTEN
jgi:hypothetical protein